jgi:hypothetical protein
LRSRLRLTPHPAATAFAVQLQSVTGPFSSRPCNMIRAFLWTLIKQLWRRLRVLQPLPSSSVPDVQPSLERYLAQCCPVAQVLPGDLRHEPNGCFGFSHARPVPGPRAAPVKRRWDRSAGPKVEYVQLFCVTSRYRSHSSSVCGGHRVPPTPVIPSGVWWPTRTRSSLGRSELRSPTAGTSELELRDGSCVLVGRAEPGRQQPP